jgi:hypothetical protein
MNAVSSNNTCTPIGYTCCLSFQLSVLHLLRTEVLACIAKGDKIMLTLAEESHDLQHYRCKAMLLANIEDCAQLCQALEEELVSDYEGWEDNGGDPDGPSWLIWPSDDILVAYADRAQVPYEVVDGFELPYPFALSEAYTQDCWDLPGQWTGVSANECAFIVSESDAAQFMQAVSETS